jgi:diaminopimelate epimerase
LKLNFFKYHGTGNDFILIDNRDQQFIPDTITISRLCHRRFGIGADGLILLEQASGFDFRMKYFNADGGESTMCGNGGRCIIALADFLSLFEKTCRFTGIDGEHNGRIIHKENNTYEVRLSMQDVTAIKRSGTDFILDTGSPHLVRIVEDVSKIDVVAEGRRIRHLDTFSPGGINVNFAQSIGEHLQVRTYERGVEDETLSCGTGVTASALAFAMTRNLREGVIRVDTLGGELAVHFNQINNIFSGIYLEGPAAQVFQGTADTCDLKTNPVLIDSQTVR